MTIAAERKPKRTRLLAVAGVALAWWLGELRDAWDELLRRPAQAGRNAATLEAGERYWILRRGDRVVGQLDRSSAEPAAIADLMTPAESRRPILVEIPPERVLAKRIVLPAAARGELDRILAFESARHFPFPAERALFCHRLIGRRASGMIEVDLIAVPRDVVAEIREGVAAAGLRTSGIAVAGEERVFLPRAAVGGGTRLGPFDRALLAAVALLAVAAIASPPIAGHLRLAAAERELAVLKPRAEAALAARDAARRAADRTAALRRWSGRG